MRSRVLVLSVAALMSAMAAYNGLTAVGITMEVVQPREADAIRGGDPAVLCGQYVSCPVGSGCVIRCTTDPYHTCTKAITRPYAIDNVSVGSSKELELCTDELCDFVVLRSPSCNEL